MATALAGMSWPFHLTLLALASALGSNPARGAVPATASSTPIVRQIDHLLLASPQPADLFKLFTETFRLPTAWPMTSYGRFASGGVALGNVNLEILTASPSAASPTASRFRGFALEPEPLKLCLPELDARQIRHGAPSPFRSRKPAELMSTLWTTVSLPEVSSDHVEVFLCEYTENVVARRRRLAEELQARDGGPLTILSVQEVWYGTRHATRMTAQWQRLLAPAQGPSPEQDTIRIGSGPLIRVIQADEEAIQGLVLRVRSLSKARQFLASHGLLGTEQPDSVLLAGPLLQGLRLTLVETAP